MRCGFRRARLPVRGEAARGIDEGKQRCAVDAVRIIIDAIDAEAEFFPLSGRKVKRPEQAIEYGQRRSEIAIMMVLMHRMVDLVVRGAQQPAPGAP